ILSPVGAISTSNPRKIYMLFCLRNMQDSMLDHFLISNTRCRSFSYNPLARHRRCDVYCGARETVGESSVSSGCWGEDSNHEYGWARRTPTYVAPIRFFETPTRS